MPAVGSSRKTSAGSCTKAAARARRRCMPPDASRTRLSRSSRSSTQSRSWRRRRLRRSLSPVHRRVEAEVLPQRQLGEQRRDLREVADAGPLGVGQLCGRGAVDPCLAGRRLVEAGQQPHGRRLAASARADQADDGAGRDSRGRGRARRRHRRTTCRARGRKRSRRAGWPETARSPGGRPCAHHSRRPLGRNNFRAQWSRSATMVPSAMAASSVAWSLAATSDVADGEPTPLHERSRHRRRGTPRVRRGRRCGRGPAPACAHRAVRSRRTTAGRGATHRETTSCRAAGGRRRGARRLRWPTRGRCRWRLGSPAALRRHAGRGGRTRWRRRTAPAPTRSPP